jgi:uncharacterized protein YaiL (DUF2058 family)
MQNLRDKLLKAGLVTAEQAEKAAAEVPWAEPKPRTERRSRAGSGQAGALADGARETAPLITARLQPLPAIPGLPHLAGSKASQRLEAKQQRERDRQLRERVLSAQVPFQPGERTFHFVTRKNRLRRLELSPAQAEALEQGRLAVVERPDPAQIEHALVPAEVAVELLGTHPKAVRFLSRPEAPVGFLTDAEVEARAAAEAAEEPEERAAAEGSPLGAAVSAGEAPDAG